MNFGDHKSSATEKIKCHKSTPQHKSTQKSMCDECVYVFNCSMKLQAPRHCIQKMIFFMFAYVMVNVLVVLLNFVKVVFICSHKSVHAPHQCED